MSALYSDVETIIRDTYLLVDPGVIRALIAAVIANKLPINPVWLFLVAGSSSGKTELLKMFSGMEDTIYHLDTLTANTFLSGSLGYDSQIFKMDNKIVTFADFTTILSMHEEARSEIMGQLRCVYDGKLTKATGNRKDPIPWEGKIGMLAGVTTAIYSHAAKYSDMGERFIMYKMIVADPEELAYRALENGATFDMKERRAAIQATVKEYIESLVIPEACPSLSPQIRRDIVRIANITTLARSAVPRDKYSRDHIITSREDRESPARMSEQLHALAMAFAVMNGSTEILETDRAILVKCALDTIPALRKLALFALTEYTSTNVQGLATHCRLPPATMQLVLEDLVALDLVNRTQTAGKGERFRLIPEHKATIASFSGITASLDELISEAQESTREPPPPDDANAPPNIMNL